jgi:hypothetical protein
MGTGLCVSAWLLTQSRRDYRRQYQEWERQTRLQQGQMQAIAHHAELEGYQQVAQLQAAERLYPQMAPYLSDVQDADYQDVTAPPHAGYPQPRQQTAAPGQPACLSHPHLSPRLTRRLPAKLPGISRAVVWWHGCREKLDGALSGDGKGASGSSGDFAGPARANHEWKGIGISVRDGLPAIAEFLQWYLDEIERRYQEFNRSG